MRCENAAVANAGYKVYGYIGSILNCMGCKDIIIVSRNSIISNVVTYYCSYL